MDIELDQSSGPLNSVTSAVEALLNHPLESAETAAAVKELADESRTTSLVRTGLGNNVPVLLSLIKVVNNPESVHRDTLKAALRCVGNACIDNDFAKRTVANAGMDWTLGLLTKPSYSNVESLVVQVLYNICSDSGEAQVACYGAKVHYGLIHVLAVTALDQNTPRSATITLLLWLTSHSPNSEQHGSLPDTVLSELLRLPHYLAPQTDAEDFAVILESFVVFLRHEEIQVRVIEGKNVDLVWRALDRNERKLLTLPANEEDRKLLLPLSTSLSWILSDIAAHQLFATVYDWKDRWLREIVEDMFVSVRPRAPWLPPRILDSRPVPELTAEIGGRGHISPPFQTDHTIMAACQVLGNLLWKSEPDSYASLVEQDHLHEPLWAMLANSEDPDVLHSAAGLLIQLSRPSVSVRETIGSDGNAMLALQRLHKHETRQLPHDAMKLLRALGKDCTTNQTKFGELAAEIMHAAAPGKPEAAPS